MNFRNGFIGIIVICVFVEDVYLIFIKNYNNKKGVLLHSFFVIGDPYGNRTHVTAVKGPCLNRLTNGPRYGSGCRI